MHAGGSHLIWHNFVTVGDNLIKMSENDSVRLADGAHFEHMA